jgi:hypothetical protein
MIGLGVGAAAQERPARDSDKDMLSLEGKKGQGWIGTATVAFHFRENGTFVITGQMTGEGMWTQTGAAVVMETARSTFKGTITGNRVSGQRTLKANRQLVDEWKVQLSDMSLNEDDSMVLIWIIVAIVAGIVLVVLIGVTAGVRRARIAADAQVKAAQLEADLKRDMLARGLSVEEIERLLKLSPSPAPLNREPLATRRPTETSLIAASAVESMCNQEKDTDDIAALLGAFLPRSDEPPETVKRLDQSLQPNGSALWGPEACIGLASAIQSMVAEGKDVEEIAAFLDAFLHRHSEPQETSRGPNESLPPTEPAVRPSEAFSPSNRPGG